MMRILLLLFLSLSPLIHSSEDIKLSEKQTIIPHKDVVKEETPVNSALTTLQSGPSAVVAGCVHAISGDYFESEVDLVIPGPIPFKVQRTYCSSGDGWQFSHMPFLHASKSDGGNHTRVIYQDDGGAQFEYYGSKKLKLRPKTIERLTNCGGGEISGRTNWKNARLTCGDKDNERYYLFTKGSGSRLVFERYKKGGEKCRYGYPQGKYQLHQIRTPHNNYLLYHYDRDDQLKRIQAVDSNSSSLITAALTHMPYITQWSLAASTATYHFVDSDKEKISTASASQKVSCSYEYDHKRITKKSWLSGNYLQINYHNFHVLGASDYRVTSLISPLGPFGDPLHTHRFYYLEGKGENSTLVIDANGGKTSYVSGDHDKRLHKIIKFQENTPYTTESFYWGQHYSPDVSNLISRTYAADDINLFCQTRHYDPNGNVLEEQLWGNLTGNNTHPIELSIKRVPKNNGCEVYSKRFTYSDDGFNLLLSEEESSTWTRYTYNEKHLLVGKVTGAEERILKREFFAYDAAGAVIEEILDDGIRHSPDDLTGVTERHRKTIVSTKKVPIGLPRIITEEYLSEGRYLLLKKTINSYSPTGKLISQEHYDSDDKLAFTLYWEYNRLDQVTQEINAIGEVISYSYDELGNKISEERMTHRKLYSYDLGNRLVEEKEVWQDGTTFTITHTYDPLGHKTSSKDIFGCTTSFVYDTFGRLIETIYPKVPFQNESVSL